MLDGPERWHMGPMRLMQRCGTPGILLWALKADVHLRCGTGDHAFRDVLQAALMGERNREDFKANSAM